MPELLLELFSEEIPARMQARAAADLERMVNDRLLAAGFLPEGVKAFATPRRLALVAAGLPARQPDRREEKKGPRVGAPEKAVEGFLKSAGLASLEACETREDKKGAYYVAIVEEKGRATAEVIAALVPEIVRGFSWPKSMRWGDGDLRWVRPLHSILCCFDGEIVPFAIDGLKSGDATRGHRFLAPGEIRARTFEKYEAALSRAHVVLDAAARAERIRGEAKTLCEAQGLELVEDAGLLAEVTGLAEWPVPMIGAFDEKFLTLPDEALSATMRGHQKYFSVRDPKTGRLADRFVCVANIEAPDGGKAMRAGYERVLTARLSDAWYLYHQDLKRPLDERIAELDRVTFFEGLGTMGDKARRIAALAKEIAPDIGADPETAERAALLAKADLVTAMVYEFPELQGVMGRYYYLAQHGISRSPAGGGAVTRSVAEGVLAASPPPSASPTPPPARERAQLKNRATWRGAGEESVRAIADAIRDHYKPAGQDDAIPTAPVSVAVALADKIDTLTAFWAIGKKPTGSSDPFALRRAALGVIRTILERDVRLSLEEKIESGIRPVIRAMVNAPDRPLNAVLRQLAEIFSDEGQGLRRDRMIRNERYRQALAPLLLDEDGPGLIPFFHERLKVYLRDKGHRYDHIDAVLAKADGTPEDDLVLIVRKLEALEAFLKTDDGANLAAGYKRAANILKIEEKKDIGRMERSDIREPASDGGYRPSASIRPTVDENLLRQDEEKTLYAALIAAEAKADVAVREERFEDAMAALASLRAPIDAFFDRVTVNADDQALRANRLALLARFRAATAKVADFSKLEG